MKLSKMGRNLLVFLGAVFVCAASTWAQTGTSVIVGTITDQQGRGVPAAKLTLINVATNTVRSVQSTDAGAYVFDLILPADSVGALMKLCEDRRGIYKKTEYIGATRVMLQYELPLAEVIYDFYDRLKSATKGYGTMDFDFLEFRCGNLVKMDILVNGDLVHWDIRKAAAELSP